VDQWILIDGDDDDNGGRTSFTADRLRGRIM